jgi:hypothetical protein
MEAYSLLALLVLMVYGVVECQQTKSFQLVVDNSGTPLCAVDPPSTTVSANDLVTQSAAAGVPGTAPLQVQCAWNCTADGPCRSFNYRIDTQLCQFCQFYNYTPSVCRPIPNCIHFQVRRIVTSTVKAKGLWLNTDSFIH